MTESVITEKGVGKAFWISHCDINGFNGKELQPKWLESLVWFTGDFKVEEKKVNQNNYHGPALKRYTSEANISHFDKTGKEYIETIQGVLQRYIDKP